MPNDNITPLLQPGAFDDPLTQVLRDGARALLAQAVEAEVAAFVDKHADLRTEDGRQRVVRHGHLPERAVMTGIGPVAVRQPRVRDRGAEAEAVERVRFTPAILPPYVRRSRSLEVLIPILYLKGVSTGDFEEALAALLGKDAPGLSASTIARLKEVWSDEHASWKKRDLSARRYVYVWADGIHLQARLEDEKQCILVIIGATPEDRKELLGFTDGARESAQDWRELLLDLKRRGLTIQPKLAVADGALGFWKAVGEVWPTTREQRCWVHKTANILNKLPKSQQPKAKRSLHEIWMAETRAEAETAFDAFLAAYALNTRRPPSVWPRIATHCSHSTTSRPSTGSTSEPPTRSRAPSPRCATAPSARRDASRTRRRWPWCSSSSRRRRKPGAGSTATTSCRRSFSAPSSPTGWRRTQPPIVSPKPPPDRSGRHQDLAIARGAVTPSPSTTAQPEQEDSRCVG